MRNPFPNPVPSLKDDIPTPALVVDLDLFEGNLQKMAEASALPGGILTMAQQRASFELQRLMLELGYTNVKFVNPTPVDPR